MDLFSMIQNATITDIDGNELGTVEAVHVLGGKMTLLLDVHISGYMEDDPDGGLEEPIPEKTEDDPVPLKMVGGDG